MKRREMLGILGTAATVGLTAGSEARADHEAEAKPKGEELPPSQFHLALCAFHVAKANPKFQVEAHHFCAGVGDGVHQCVIYDSREKGAKLIGVEYIITDAIYQTLPAAEKAYYHPHTYEITAGLLVIPGMSAAEEDAVMGKLITTWGKTWHTWPDPKTPLPMGDPILMWAFTEDGQINPALVEARDSKLKMSTPEVRKRRARAGLDGK
ncbi:MAG: hypothetical protein JWN86_2920 [Planctomycetota bacterium]|nr:hypothetical protein [Planctomycetota bacterium]